MKNIKFFEFLPDEIRAKGETKIKKKRDEITDIKLSLKNSRDAVALLIDIRDAVRESRSKKKKKRITKKKYSAIRKLMKKRK